MLSNKMTFSLMSLITILALAFAVSPAIAGTFNTKITYDEAENVDGRQVDVTIMFDQVVALTDVRAHHPTTAATKMIDVIVVMSDFSSMSYRMMADGTGGFHDVAVTPAAAITDFGPIMQKDMDPSTPGGQYDGKTFTFTIPATQLPRADDPATPVVETGTFANKVYVSITGDPDGTDDGTIGIPSLDPGNMDTSEPANLAIDLRTVAMAQDRDTPAVVSIQRLRPGSQTVVDAFQESAVTEEFTVRIVLSETPDDPANFHKKINVANAEKDKFVIGTPFARHGALGDDPHTTDTEGADVPIPGQTIRPHPIEGRYNHDGVVTVSLGDTAGATVFTPLAGVPEGLDEVKVPLPTGPTGMYWECRIEISPHRRATSVTIKIDEFHDGDTPRNYYYPHQVDKKPNGREQLHLPVALEQFNFDDGRRVNLPHAEKAKITYANGKAGHYILATNKEGSHIKYYYHEDTSTAPRENKPLEQTPAELLYNVRESTALPNLETFFANHGTIHLVSYGGHKAGDAYISEVMWGTDASQDPVRNSNWIEIANGTSAAIEIGDKIWALWFYEAHETPAPSYDADSYYEGPIGQAGTIIDVIGTKASDTGLSWSIAGKGKSGRTNIDIARVETQVLTPIDPLISMYRVMNADGTLSDGTQSDNWMRTAPPSVNVGGPEIATNLGFRRENAIVATPGAAPFATPDTLKDQADADQAKIDQATADQLKIASTGTYPMRGDGLVYISEIMVDRGNALPQWIEIANGDRSKEFNLSGWTLTVDNAAADTDVPASIKFTIPAGTIIDPSAQDDTPSTILVVTEAGRTNIDDGPGTMGEDQIINLWDAGQTELLLADITKRRYALISDEAFEITLAPPAPAKTNVAGLAATATVDEKATARAADAAVALALRNATDRVGNLGADGAAAWALPMSTGEGRSSIIRRHALVSAGPAAPLSGNDMKSWMLASDTAFIDAVHGIASSYYGAMSDVGTPGFRAGGALPVELSHFRPVRDKMTGAVVITWATQSELNNAGFFIKRSQQRDGEFQVINAAMVPGAGTTSEKQFYTYSDTTAQPNVVYYYQIEDVSLDGNRQTLTRGIRLKGHVGAAGKLTSIWGELKSSNE